MSWLAAENRARLIDYSVGKSIRLREILKEEST
jgi:hypothetical protein